MANETVVPVNLRQQAWAKQAWAMAQKDVTISNLIGNSTENVVQRDDTLKKEAGDQITFSLRLPLTGASTEGDDVLEGNEEAQEYYDFKVVINQLRHATRLKGKMEEKRTCLRLRTDAKLSLKDWFAEKIESKFFTALNTLPSANRILLPDGIAAVNLIAAANKMSCAIISKAKRKARKMLTIVDAAGVSHIVPKLRPIMIEGKKMYAFIISEEQARDLHTDSVWISAQSNANVRGDTNPFFTGAEGVWEGVAIFVNEHVEVLPTGLSGLAVGHGLFMGAQAACFAVGSDPEWEEEEFDFKNKVAFEMGQIFGIAKTVFDGEDTGVIHVYTASVQDA